VRSRYSPRFGLILPALFDIVPVLVPLAALGLVLLMMGAAATHAKRREGRMIVVNSILASLAAVVVWGRFGPVSFSQ
jgi:DoxX-like family